MHTVTDEKRRRLVERRPMSSIPAAPVVAPVLLALALTACSSVTAPDLPSLNEGRDGGEEILFFTQNGTPEAMMEALFDGRVVLAPDGCLRLDSHEAPTVIWPVGYRLVDRDGELVVRDAEGREVGRVGGSFRFSGGTVPALDERMALDEETRERAERRCPGRYWIVGERVEG